VLCVFLVKRTIQPFLNITFTIQAFQLIFVSRNINDSFIVDQLFDFSNE